MDKKIWFVLVIALAVIIGAVFVSANFAADNTQEPQEKQISPAACNAQTCDGQCGGSCGVPKCGCQR